MTQRSEDYVNKNESKVNSRKQNLLRKNIAPVIQLPAPQNYHRLIDFGMDTPV